MSTIWLSRTNKGKVVYNRKLHSWTVRDVERIVKRFAEQVSSPEPLMMSEIADRLLFWLAERLGLDDLALFAAPLVVRLFDLVRKIKADPLPLMKGRGYTIEDLLAWVSAQAGIVAVGDVIDRKTALEAIRHHCLLLIEYLDKELA